MNYLSKMSQKKIYKKNSMKLEGIKITFIGRMGKQARIQSSITELEKDYDVTQSSYEKFSSFNGFEEQTIDLLKLIVNIASPIGIYLKVKGLELIFKEGIFEPFAKWLENSQTNIDGSLVDEIEYKFDDVTI